MHISGINLIDTFPLGYIEKENVLGQLNRNKFAYIIKLALQYYISICRAMQFPINENAYAFIRF